MATHIIWVINNTNNINNINNVNNVNNESTTPKNHLTKLPRHH